MPPKKHAVLSASSSHRWLNCNPSARLELEFEDRTSVAAAEGTAAHAWCEFKLQQALGFPAGEPPISEYDSPEMDAHTDAYVEFVLEALEEAKQNCPDPQLLIEQKLDFSCYVPDGFGTGDCIIVADRNLHIIDMKYGQGVLVEAEENPQMMLYALGALRIYDFLYDIQTVSMTIFQPRRENVSTWTIPVVDLKEWANTTLKEKAELAYKGEGEFTPGPHCQFCKAAVRCRARAEANLRLAQYEFTRPPLLTDEEIEDILAQIPDLEKWCSEIAAYAQDAAVNHGKHWTGFKLVESRTTRRYINENAVIAAVTEAGYDPFEKKVLGLTAMQKALGKAKFEALLGHLIEKPQGKPTLVPVTDKRPAITTTGARHDFNEFMEE